MSKAGGLMVAEVCGAISASGPAIGLLYGKKQTEAAVRFAREFMLGMGEKIESVR